MESRGRGYWQQAVRRDFCHLVPVAPASVLLVGTAGEQRGSLKCLKVGQMRSNEAGAKAEGEKMTFLQV